jgi:GTP-binding protein
MENVLSTFPESETTREPEPDGIKVAILGRPNVGKSTLVNRMLGYERIIAYDEPGTTRDSIFIPFERDGQLYTLIDTAGIRRRAKVYGTVEKFSIIKAFNAIEASNVVIMILDAHEGITDQDTNLLGQIIDSGRALIIAVNKWDGVTDPEEIRRNLSRKLHFIDFAKIHFISALHGRGVSNLFNSIQSAWQAANREINTARLNEVLQKAVSSHPPPLVRGRRVKLRYINQGGTNPPRFIIHGNQVKSLPSAYKRYLINLFRTTFKLDGTPIQLEFRQGDNPYEGRKNVLTPHQEKKRKRLIQHVKKKTKPRKK